MSIPKKVLVAEDDATWRAVFANLVDKEGYLPYPTDSLHGALEIIKEHQVDLAILDISLNPHDPHNRDGLNLLERLVEVNPQVQIIVISGSVELQDEELEASQPAIKGVIDKRRFDSDALRTLLRDLTDEINPPHITERPGAPSAFGGPLSRLPPAAKRLGNALIVEDNILWQGVIAGILEQIGMSTTCVPSLSIALGELRLKNYSLVTLDLKLRSSREQDNREGRDLLQETKARGIPTIIISAYIDRDEIKQDYEQFGVLQMIDKIAFERGYLKELVTGTVSAKRSVIPDELLFKVVQSVLRQSASLSEEIATSPSIIKLGNILDKKPKEFIDELRTAIEASVNELTSDAEREEMRLAQIDPRGFQNTGDFTQELIFLLRGVSKVPGSNSWWPLRSERMTRVFVLHALYLSDQSRDTLAPLLLDKLALEKGALERLRKQGVFELLPRLRTRWP